VKTSGYDEQNESVLRGCLGRRAMMQIRVSYM